MNASPDTNKRSFDHSDNWYKNDYHANPYAHPRMSPHLDSGSERSHLSGFTTDVYAINKQYQAWKDKIIVEKYRGFLQGVIQYRRQRFQNFKSDRKGGLASAGNSDYDIRNVNDFLNESALHSSDMSLINRNSSILDTDLNTPDKQGSYSLNSSPVRENKWFAHHEKGRIERFRRLYGLEHDHIDFNSTPQKYFETEEDRENFEKYL